MANKSVLSKPSVAESLPRNPFNRSGYRNFSQSAGMLIPVFAEPCIAGTKGVLNRSIFTRSAQVSSPAFPDVKQSVEFFKVPLRYLLSSWNDWKLNINDIVSTAVVSQTNGVPNLTLPNNIPCMNFGGDSSGNTLTDRTLTALTTALVPTSQQPKFVNDMFRLLQGLGYIKGDLLGAGSGSTITNVKNLFKIAAYNKVYYDHFRNTTYESNNPYTYNLDWLLNPNNATNCTLNPSGGPLSHAQVFYDMFKLKYVNYKNDYYHNFFPSLNTSVSVPRGTWSLPASVVGATTGSPNTLNEPILSPLNFTLQPSPSVQTASNMSVSVQQIRSLFALDKLMRASAYTPKHVRDQLKARFGVDVGDKVSFESEKLGGFDNTIVFGEVTNTAASSGYNLGELGGKGVSAKNFENDIHFYCEEDSLIIGVSYIKPSPCYDFIEDEWDNNLVKEDFWQPEFANLGLRPVYNQYQNVIAYTVPYQRYKLGRDMNLGIFNEYNVELFLNGGVITSNALTGALSNFAVHSRLPSNWNGPVSAEYFKVLPSHLDSIFTYSYDSNLGSPQTDQFFYHLDIKFAVTANMSVHGVPRL